MLNSQGWCRKVCLLALLVFIGVISPQSSVVTAQPLQGAAIRVTDAQGDSVQALSLNANGWPIINSATGQFANPITVSVQLNCPVELNKRCDGLFFLEMGSSPSRARFYLVETDFLFTGFCSASTRPEDDRPSLTRYSAQCGNVDLPSGGSVQYTWRFWIQPSEQTSLAFVASYGDGDGASVAIPRAAIYPVVFLPGITATLPPSYDVSRVEQLLSVASSSFFANYTSLYAALERLGYTKDVTYFRFPYDWTRSSMTSALRLRDDLLIPKAVSLVNVPWVAGAGGSPTAIKYDFIGHSGGNLVARAYVQGPHWQGYARRLVSIGGPHKGLVTAYTLLEGREAFLVDWDWPIGFLADQFALPRAIAAGYGDRRVPGGGISALNKYLFVHDPIEGPTNLPHLLPTYSELDYLVGANGSFPFGRIVNPLLENNVTNGVSLLDPYKVGPPSTITPTISIVEENIRKRYPGFAGTTFYGLNTPAQMDKFKERMSGGVCVIFAGSLGTNEDTRVRLMIGDRSTQPPFWWTGKLESNVLGPGDDLVPGFSGNPRDIWRPGTEHLLALDLDAEFAASHLKLAGYPATLRRTSECLIGTVPPFLSPVLANAWFPDEAEGDSLLNDFPRTMLIISSVGPVEMTLTDPKGRQLGYVAGNPEPISEVPNGTYAPDDSGVNYLIVAFPFGGEYTIKVTGVGDGDFIVLGSSYNADSVTDILDIRGRATAGSIATQQVEVAGESETFVYLPVIRR